MKPKIVVDYNFGKTGVDTVDQLRQYYAMQRRGRKDWPSLAWWLIDICIINSYTLWCLDKSANISQLDFRKALLLQIPAVFPPPSTRVHLAPTPPVFAPSDGHWPLLTDDALKCAQCPKGRLQGRRSKYICEVCRVHLCVSPCFKLYHTRQEEHNA